MTNIFVFLLLILSIFVGHTVCDFTQKMVDTKTSENKTNIQSYYVTPYVVVQTYSILRGRCGCFDYSGQIITYNPTRMCVSILLCRMLYNIAMTQHLHFKMTGELLNNQAQSEIQDVKPAIGLPVKEQDAEDHVIHLESTGAINNITSCLSKLLQKDVPLLLVKLQNLLCLFQQGKNEHNEALYKEFLKQLNTALKDVGCSLDEVLNTKNILEQVSDNAGKIADRVVFEILRIADDLELTGQLLNTVCKLLGKTLTNLSDSLSGLNLDLGLTKLVGGILG